VVEYTGLGSELLAEHVGGVVRVSLAASTSSSASSSTPSSGGLVLSDGLPAFPHAAFSEEAVPASALGSVEAFRGLVLSLLQRQGLR
jgi:hypothetical protein